MHLGITLFSIAIGLQVVSAQTSLWVPGFDEQALSADVIGVDDKGRTSYRIQRGKSTAQDDDQSGFTGTFTLVEGTDYASYNLAIGEVTMTMDCSISGSIGLCSGQDGPTIATATETVKPFLVQIGATAAPTGAGAGAPTTGSGGNSAKSTGSSGANPTQSSKPNGASKATMSGLAGIALGAAGAVVALM